MFHIGWIAFVMVLVIGGVAYWPWLLVTAIVSMVGGLLRFRRRARRRARAREGHHTALLVGFGLQGWFVQTTHPALVRHLHAAYGDDVSVA